MKFKLDQEKWSMRMGGSMSKSDDAKKYIIPAGGPASPTAGKVGAPERG